MAHAQKTNPPYSPLVKERELQGIAIKIPIWKRGIEGDLSISQWNGFMANVIMPPERERQGCENNERS
jgi:hypothetical protein